MPTFSTCDDTRTLLKENLIIVAAWSLMFSLSLNLNDIREVPNSWNMLDRWMTTPPERSEVFGHILGSVKILVIVF